MFFNQKLRVLQIERYDIDDIVDLLAGAKVLMDTYQENGVPLPDWLEDNTKTLRNELNAKRRDALEKAFKSAKLKREGLRSVDEKRKALDDEINRLGNALGYGASQVPGIQNPSQ